MDSSDGSTTVGERREVAGERSQAWTFVGHWEGGRIVTEYVLEGEHEDLRHDAGFWEEGLFAASAQAATLAAAEEALRAEYEQHDDT